MIRKDGRHKSTYSLPKIGKITVNSCPISTQRASEIENYIYHSTRLSVDGMARGGTMLDHAMSDANSRRGDISTSKAPLAVMALP